MLYKSENTDKKSKNPYQTDRNVDNITVTDDGQAFIMGSLNPVNAIGLGDEIGSIAPGKKADLVFVDDKFHVKQVMVGIMVLNQSSSIT